MYLFSYLYLYLYISLFLPVFVPLFVFVFVTQLSIMARLSPIYFAASGPSLGSHEDRFIEDLLVLHCSKSAFPQEKQPQLTLGSTLFVCFQSTKETRRNI